MDKSSIVKLRNYFSDRIEEIKDGNYVPTYEQIKELPEFSGINQETYRIARKKWYWQYFRMSSVRFAARLENIKMGFISENKFATRLENIKGGHITEEDYDKELIMGNSKVGFCILILGALFIIYALVMGATMGWDPSYAGGWFGLSIIVCGVPGILLLSIGIFLILHNRSKANKI